MFKDFSQFAFQVNKALRGEGVTVPASHVQQLLSALMGYKSLAAMHAAAAIESPGVGGARFLVCDENLAQVRAQQLGHPPALVPVVIAASKQVAKGQLALFGSEAQFIDDHVQPEVASNGVLEDVLSGTMGTMNAYGPAWIDVEFETPTPLDLAPGGPWVLEMSGTLTMEADRERPFSGSKVVFDGEIEFQRAGVRLLMGKPKVTATGDVADF